MTRLPDVPAGTRLLPDARLYQVWEPGPSMALVASFSALESAVEHIEWMLRNEPMKRVTLDILPPTEVQAPCSACGDALMVPVDVGRRIVTGELTVYHSADGHRVLAGLNNPAVLAASWEASRGETGEANPYLEEL